MKEIWFLSRLAHTSGLQTDSQKKKTTTTTKKKKKKTKTNGVLNILFLFFWLFSQNPMKNGTSSTKVLTYIK